MATKTFATKYPFYRVHTKFDQFTWLDQASKQASLFFPKYLHTNMTNEYNIRAGCQKGHRPIKLAT